MTVTAERMAELREFADRHDVAGPFRELLDAYDALAGERDRLRDAMLPVLAAWDDPGCSWDLLAIPLKALRAAVEADPS